MHVCLVQRWFFFLVFFFSFSFSVFLFQWSLLGIFSRLILNFSLSLLIVFVGLCTVHFFLFILNCSIRSILFLGLASRLPNFIVDVNIMCASLSFGFSNCMRENQENSIHDPALVVPYTMLIFFTSFKRALFRSFSLLLSVSLPFIMHCHWINCYVFVSFRISFPLLFNNLLWFSVDYVALEKSCFFIFDSLSHCLCNSYVSLVLCSSSVSLVRNRSFFFSYVSIWNYFDFFFCCCLFDQSKSMLFFSFTFALFPHNNVCLIRIY